MQSIKNNLNNDEYLESVDYTASDKDMGYRSGLRYLQLEQTEETGEIANIMIYGEMTIKPIIQIYKPTQLQLF
jgi:hypothetical protein